MMIDDEHDDADDNDDDVDDDNYADDDYDDDDDDTPHGGCSLRLTQPPQWSHSGVHVGWELDQISAAGLEMSQSTQMGLGVRAVLTPGSEGVDGLGS
eukprot:8926184-Karenia_brevis.AAC.1